MDKSRQDLIQQICNLTSSLNEELQIAAFSQFLDRHKEVEYQINQTTGSVIISSQILTDNQLLDLYKKLNIYSA